MQLWFRQGIWASKKAKKNIKKLDPLSIKSIAVIRHQALGDMVLIRAFLIEARKAFPNASITLSLIDRYTLGAPEDLVDRVHVINRKATASEKYKQTKELGYHDFIFDLASTPRSRQLCLLNKALIKFGFPYKKFRAFLYYDIAIPRNDLTYEVDDMLKMLQAVGVKTTYPHIFDLPGEAIKRDKNYVVYFIGASNTYKMWPTENYAEIISRLSDEFPQFEHLILEGINHWEKADAPLSEISSRDNVSIIEPDTIDFAISLLKGATLSVSNDTGIRHLAVTAGTPTVGIFHANPYRYWPRYNHHDIVMKQEDGPALVDEVHQSCVNTLKHFI